MNILLDLIVLCVALFLIGWYLIHRFRVRHFGADGNITAFSTLKALMIFFLLMFALGAAAFAVGALVWFGLGHFIPGISDESRVSYAAMAATIIFLYLLVGQPLSLALEAKKKATGPADE
ncbi:MAG: hypothetical protein AB1450_01695 [Pseudomonadota bacterium]